MADLKSKVLDATDGGRRIFEDLYPGADKIFATGKGFIKMRSERTASASFKLIEKKGEKYWILHDFGNDLTLNAIDAYMQENGILYFKEALYRLAEEYNIDYSLDPKINKARIKTRPMTSDDKDSEVKWEVRDITKEELAIMGPTVTKEVMDAYNYKALAWYSICKNGKVTIFSSNENYPIFMHDCGTFQKIYKPFEYDKAYRFYYVGSKPANYVFGLDEAKNILKERQNKFDDLVKNDYSLDLAEQQSKLEGKKLPELIICSGERDAMCIAGLGYIPIWFNSESAKKSLEQINVLYDIANRVYNIPDKDTAGIENGRKMALDHINIYTIELPEWLSQFKDARMRPCKDLRDYVELRPSKNEFERLINSAQRAKFWIQDGKKIQIKSLNLLYFLRLNGFHKYKDPITSEIKLVRVEGFKVTEYEPVQIRDFVRYSLRNFQVGNDVMEAYINSKKTTKQIYDDLETIDIDFVSSTPEGRTLYFENVICKITHNLPNKDNPDYTGIETTKEPSGGQYIWEGKIIPHKFSRLKPAFHIDWEDKRKLYIHTDNNPSLLLRYFINSSRLYWRKELEQWHDEGLSDEQNAADNAQYAADNKFNIYGPRLTEEEMTDQMLCFSNKLYILGYLIHRYKIASNAKAIWAMEYKNPVEGQSNGRSGKSFFFQAIEKLHLCETETMNGRNSKLTDNNFFMDRVSKSTDILLIDEVNRNSDFDTFYTMITGSMTINPKNEKSFELKYEDAPNIAFTSNFAPPNLDASTLARLLFMVFSDYYHEQSDYTNYLESRSIRDDVGDMFEANYTEEQYNADINFCIDCLQFYLSWRKMNLDAIKPPMQGIKKRSQEQEMGQAFLQWAREYFDRDGIHIDRPIVRQVAYNDYCSTITKGKEIKSKTTWMKALRIYARYCDDIECVNPQQHPWYREDGDRLSGKTTVKDKYGSYEMIYLKTYNCEDMSTDVITY